MVELAKSSVSLGFWDDALDPVLVSELLECEPSVGVAKGGEWTTATGVTKIAPTGSWRLKVARREPGDLGGQIREVLSLVTSDLSRWGRLPKFEKARLFCGIFLAAHNEGSSISAETLARIAERGLSLELDIYGAD
jgi:hypothetical protein